MTSFRQLEANCRNALKSSGPKTEAGKQRSRRNAIRHGLTAETVIDVLEDAEDYKAFEACVTADFDAQTAVERELVLRLVSLLWRLRRATAIETGLFQIQTEMDSDLGAPKIADLPLDRALNALAPAGLRPDGKWSRSGQAGDQFVYASNDLQNADSADQSEPELNSVLASRFLRLDDEGFERLGRYETALWRQVYQVIFVLDALRRQGLDLKWLPRPSRSNAHFRSPRSGFSKP